MKKTLTPASTSFLTGRLPAHWLPYVQLMRIDRPIGSLLLLWPTYWALWLAADGVPDLKNLVIFTLGVFLMRSAGCVINDYADRDFDGHVKRTQQRPLATGKVTPKSALILFAALVAISFVLVLFTNQLTILLSFGGLALAAVYPFMKRHSHLPQVVLGAAFGWSIPMAYAAQAGTVPPEAWLLYTANLVWTVTYDTFYAMVDRDDDLQIGVKSTAILFGESDRAITASLQVFTVLVLCFVGERAELGNWYFLSVVAAATLFVYQQHLIRDRERDACFKAFLNNNWVGFSLFLGIVLDYAL